MGISAGNLGIMRKESPGRFRFPGYYFGYLRGLIMIEAAF
jgi:hypothetical protein